MKKRTGPTNGLSRILKHGWQWLGPERFFVTFYKRTPRLFLVVNCRPYYLHTSFYLIALWDCHGALTKKEMNIRSGPSRSLIFTHKLSFEYMNCDRHPILHLLLLKSSMEEYYVSAWVVSSTTKGDLMSERAGVSWRDPTDYHYHCQIIEVM